MFKQNSKSVMDTKEQVVAWLFHMFFGGWVVMLTAGSLHSYVERVPAVNYWVAVGVVAAASWLFDPPFRKVVNYRPE